MEGTAKDLIAFYKRVSFADPLITEDPYQKKTEDHRGKKRPGTEIASKEELR